MNLKSKQIVKKVILQDLTFTEDAELVVHFMRNLQTVRISFFLFLLKSL